VTFARKSLATGLTVFGVLLLYPLFLCVVVALLASDRWQAVIGALSS